MSATLERPAVPQPAQPGPAQKAELRAVLQARQTALDTQLAEHQQGRSRAEFAAELLAQDGDDAPQRDADREVALARADQALRELGQVSDALRRLSRPDYGDCTDCGEPIAFARLRAEPWALRCVACETRHEGPLAGATPRL